MQPAHLIEDLQRIAVIAAAVWGMLWTYFNFLRGRTYKPRLEIKIEGRLEFQGNGGLALITCMVKNVGLSSLFLKQEGSALRYESCAYGFVDCETVLWRQCCARPVLTDHSWIEPNETVSEQHILIVPGHTRAIRATLRVVSRRTRLITRSGKEWNSTSIILPTNPHTVDAVVQSRFKLTTV